MGDASEGSKETPCPGCGVAIFQGQGVCSFCARGAAAGESARRVRQIAVRALLGLVLTGALAVAALGLWSYLDGRRSTPVTPEPLPPPPVSVDVTRTAVLLNGKELFPLPPPAEQARLGLGPAGTTDTMEESGVARLSAALTRARQARRDDSGVDLRFAPDAPAVLVDRVWSVAEAFDKRRLSVAASPAGPATTVFSVKVTDTKDLPEVDLQVEIRTHGVAISMLGEGGLFTNVGVGCAFGQQGLAVMLRKPEDYAVLKRCFTSLRARLAADALTRPVLTAFGQVPAAKVLYVLNLLRCAELRCPEEPRPRLWGPITFLSTDEFSHTVGTTLPIFMVRLEPALRDCYEAQRTQLSERTYETEVHFDTDESGRLSFAIQPGLPESLELCARRVIDAAHITLPNPPNEYMTSVPLAFGPLESP